MLRHAEVLKVGSLDDLPTRPESHRIAAAAVSAFRLAVDRTNLFIVRPEGELDYGTDFQLEAVRGDTPTNLRAHVQVKGTEANSNADGSVSLTVDRTNLNYLLSPPYSLYVCHHLPTERLFARYASDVYDEYERAGQEWQSQKTVTVRFSEAFDEQLQHQLHRLLLAAGTAARDEHLAWTVTPPSSLSQRMRTASPPIALPADLDKAQAILVQLYEAGEDVAISNAFDKFAALLASPSDGIHLAFMAEINLAINGMPFDKARVEQGIELLGGMARTAGVHDGSILYSIGNGWLALHDYEQALASYEVALAALSPSAQRNIVAACKKNMGSALEAIGRHRDARACYEEALELHPDLPEAQFALGLWHYRAGEYNAALTCLDQLVLPRNSRYQLSVQGWRSDLLFRSGDGTGAFREINGLISAAGDNSWIWPWCANLVAKFGTQSVESAQLALRFWRRYLDDHPDQQAAERARLLCVWYLRAEGASVEMDFPTFAAAAARLIEAGAPDAAFLWDRVGHWAQCDGNWPEAERVYRRAFALEPVRYGYCLGTAMNFLDRHEEALPILLAQAEWHQPDAMSWFQVAIAREGVGDVEGALSAYRRAVELDPEYALAWFNLGGVLLNAGASGEAASIWREALSRFPDHPLAEALRQDFGLTIESPDDV